MTYLIIKFNPRYPPYRVRLFDTNKTVNLTPCLWVENCPSFENLKVPCYACPAYTHCEKLTFDEAVEWWASRSIDYIKCCKIRVKTPTIGDKTFGKEDPQMGISPFE